MVVEPTADAEQELAAQFFERFPSVRRAVVIGLDEVGRGALAGPVMVGAFALGFTRAESAGTDSAPTVTAGDGARLAPVALPIPDELPAGIRDSKLLTPKRRSAVCTALQADDALVWAVGRASALEIDEVGISQALGQAAARALAAVGERLAAEQPNTAIAGVILDGNLDVVSGVLSGTQVLTRAKADRDCLSVAAASVLAKVERDDLMTAISEHASVYGWASNKGYGSAAHRAAIAEHGLHPEHRASWKLT